MTPTQALQAVALLGGLTAASRLILNMHGNPLDKASLSRRISQPSGVPEWLADQLYSAVSRHGESCERWAMDVAAGDAVD